MDPLQLWAGVRFAAQNGNAGGLLTAAAQNGLHLSAITAQPGGFCARCAAWRYPELSRLARRYRVRLRVQKRDGLFFRLRPLLRRRGLWAGLFLFLPLLLWLQGAVWATDFTTLTPGQRARAEVILRQQALSAGEFVSEEKLTAGEYALLQSGEFSWASLNFSKGRLSVEAAAAKPVPDIASGTLHGITARVAGTVLETNLTSGTMLVTPGQAKLLPTRRVKAVDSTGAGDCFNGVAAGLLADGKELEEAVRTANIAASISTTREGAMCSMPTREEVEAVRRQCSDAGEEVI